MIGYLEMERRARPLGQLMPSTCPAWHPLLECNAPVEHPAVQAELYPQPTLQGCQESFEGTGLAAGRLQRGGSVEEVQTVLSPSRCGGHLLFQDTKPLLWAWYNRRLTFKRDNKHCKLSTCGVSLAPRGDGLLYGANWFIDTRMSRYAFSAVSGTCWCHVLFMFWLRWKMLQMSLRVDM
jgi:hypothetical protein